MGRPLQDEQGYIFGRRIDRYLAIWVAKGLALRPADEYRAGYFARFGFDDSLDRAQDSQYSRQSAGGRFVSFDHRGRHVFQIERPAHRLAWRLGMAMKLLARDLSHPPQNLAHGG